MTVRIVDQPATNDAISAGLVWPAQFTQAECERLRAIADERTMARVGVYPTPSVSIRRACAWEIDLAREEQFAWLKQKLQRCQSLANEYFNFAIDEAIEPVLCVRYAVGDHFDWHIDLGSGLESTRKIALSVQLSKPEDYIGGSLQLLPMTAPFKNLPLGSVVAFPAFMAHRVMPVTSGERWALVAWIHGPAFR